MSLGRVLIVSGLFVSCAAAGNVNYIFSFSGGSITASGTFTVSTTGDPNVDDITSISGTFLDTGTSRGGTITGLLPGSYNASSPTTLPDYTFDNLFYPNGSPATCFSTSGFGQLDTCGMAFALSDGSHANLYGDSSGSSGPAGYYAGDANGGSVGPNGQVTATFTPAATDTPEPGTWLGAASALLLAGLRRVRRR